MLTSNSFAYGIGVDEAWSKALAEQLKAGGYSFIIGYVSQDTTGKNLTKDDVQAAHLAGLDVGLVYEFSATSALGGSTAGARDANIAVAHAREIGAPQGICLYAAIDFNATPAQLPLCLDYMMAYHEFCVATNFDSGSYGGKTVIDYLDNHQYKGRLWQTYAWSHGLWNPHVSIRQLKNGVTIAGANVDIDELETPNWGQWRANMSRTLTDEDIQAVVAAIFNHKIGGSNNGAGQEFHFQVSDTRDMIVAGGSSYTGAFYGPLADIVKLLKNTASTLTPEQVGELGDHIISGLVSYIKNH